ncbi:hypothetical protein GCM10020331_041190 [Ectobacillus funiculus]
MIVVDRTGCITLFNKSAEQITGYNGNEVIGKYIAEVITGSQLPRVLHTGAIEVHRELELENGTKLITTRIPIISEDGEITGGRLPSLKILPRL